MTGALRLAATVCPTSTLREMTMPSIGEVIVQWSRSTFAFCSAPSLIFTLACAWCKVGLGLVEIGLRGVLFRDQVFGSLLQ